MLISILTLFPESFSSIFSSSILGRSQKYNKVKFNFINIRDFASDNYKSVDGRPYGGGIGMIIRIDIVDKALIKALELEKVVFKTPKKITRKIVLLDATGSIFTQQKARVYSKLDHLILICGHYEGVDGRVYKLVDESLSIGPYILTGGEIPAMVVADSVVRLIRGVLKKNATLNESHEKLNVLEAFQYTRPEVYKKMKVPKILLSGNHVKIAEWIKKKGKARSVKN